MVYKVLTLAAAVAMCAGIAACSSDKPEGSLPPAKPAAEAAPADEGAAPADNAMAAEDMSADETAAAPAEDTTTEETVTEQTTTEEISPQGVETVDTTTETTTTETTTEQPAQQAAYEARLSERQMLRDVRNGSHAIRDCRDIADVNLKTFNACVNSTLSTAESDGKLTDSYQLGANYEAWVFLGDHAKEMHEKGYEWTKEYRQIFASRALYKTTVQNLMAKTGLPPDEVCDQLSAECPAKK